MKAIIAAVLMAMSFGCMAGYKGQDPMEMSRTADRAGNGYYLYSYGVGKDLLDKAPACQGRQHMLMELNTGHAVFGCWWRIDEQLYGYTEHTGTIKFVMDLMTVNDNFTGRTGTGF